ncbi:murein DD-endopeptidase MepM/ murein hydrolase activator NlpD [Sphingobium sp. OAS761]|uniref:M23 family metallopeptidase n=1 Tax=Sphingobium sp. OAS761 TaxID=2817901 RepID=UPI00209EF6AA|nr:M23 family metallopeptidase [Sphingobium sp. OAS761]MCP1471418.1 murein DD-endopeptidase MepM/ murein hydrolase activator NlpD [Sphingobium sp. OAS761]
MNRARLWGGAAITILLCAVFLRACVRIVPPDRSEREPMASAPPSPASVPMPSPSNTGPLLIPVSGVAASALVDTFAQARDHGGRPHDAIDIMAERGRAVLAAADGPVEKLFWSDAGGRTLYQRADGGRLLLYYAHLDGYAPGVREGISVRKGQQIATVGSTGNADPAAPHLHFAVHVVRPDDPWYAGRPVNPYPLLTRR